jgi:undecaprenyl-diphosphatase
VGNARITQQISAFDVRVSNRLRLDTMGAPTWIVTTVRRFSQAGSYGIGWFALFAAVLSWAESWKYGLTAAALVLATLLINTGIKSLTRRPRPKPVDSNHAPTTSSMPSAHAAMAATGAVVMINATPPELAVLWIGVALALGVSRVMLGAHYVGDVVVGLAWGTVFAIAALPTVYDCWVMAGC